MRKLWPKINFYAEQSDFDEVNKALKTNKDIRMHIRYEVVLNYLQGYQLIEIAKMHNISSQTVGNYIKRYKSGGLIALVPHKSKGAPRHLNNNQ